MADTENKKYTALVTGGSRGIGREISLHLAHTVAHTIVVNYLQDDVAADLVRGEVEAAGSRCLLARHNLAYPEEIAALFQDVRSITERLDIFVHCAALGAFKSLIDIKPNQWDLSFNVNTRSFLLCVQQCLPLMERGKIVALSSLGAQRAIPNYGAIGPSKAALEAVVRQLAMELAPRGIAVNGVCAGLVPTDSIRLAPNSRTLAEEVERRTPAGRLATTSDIANVVMFLVSPEADWVCGQVIIADGGMSLV
jgi:enoyl-[acyl-carrier protein] reductase III